MKLSDILFRWKKRLPGGHLFRGKYRLVKQVTPLHIARQMEAYKLEERNMFYLRHPYLTSEQAYDSVTACNECTDSTESKTEESIKRFRKHKLLGDRFGFLKVADRWE